MTLSPKYVVCPDCEGEGTHGPGFVYTQEDIDQDFADFDDFREHMDDIRSGVYDQRCSFCKGRRVVEDVIDYEGVRTTARERWQDEVEYRAEVAAEMRFGA